MQGRRLNNEGYFPNGAPNLSNLWKTHNFFESNSFDPSESLDYTLVSILCV